PVTNKNTVSVNFPDNAGIKTWAFKSFGGYGTRAKNNILFVYCPNTLTVFDHNPFQETQVIVAEIDDETPVTQIPQNFAHEARNLESINIPAAVTLINGDSGKNGAPFYNGYSLESVTFASMDNLTVMKKSVFANCTSLKTVKLPNSVTEIGERCFENCKSLTSVSLGASVTKTTGYSVFRLCNSLNVYYIPSTLQTVFQHTFTHDSGAGPANTVFFYVGTKAELETFYNASVSGKNNDRVTSGYKAENVIEWDPTKPDSYYIDLATTNNCKYYVYGYNACNAFYNGIHTEKTEDNNACWLTECAKCGVKDVYSGNDNTHNLTTEMLYENYLANGVKKSYCTNAKCTHPVTEEALAPLFTFKGYSSNNDGEICVTYLIDKDAINVYTEFCKDSVKLSYGIVCAANNTNPYELTTNVVKADLTNEAYTAVDFKLSGLSEATKDVAISMNMYVAETKGDNTTVKYLTSQGTSTSAEAVTYASAPKEEN
ncbi:MAG: leucine-rich repeat domain-containing protein, partial [Clostridia bacterium]|nr:leucine-rich repeat domain-containing protein [Clostridia bacterium]